jgi:hypothetical protein
MGAPRNALIAKSVTPTATRPRFSEDIETSRRIRAWSTVRTRQFRGSFRCLSGAIFCPMGDKNACRRLPRPPRWKSSPPAAPRHPRFFTPS